MKNLALLFVIVALENQCADKPEIQKELHYEGQITIATGCVFSITITIGNDNQATISSSLGLRDQVISVLSNTRDSLVFVEDGYHVAYKGAYSQDRSRIAGIWSQGDKLLPLMLALVEPNLQKDVFDIEGVISSEISIESGKVTLSGTLTKPKVANDKLPAIVLLGVAGKTDRDMSFGPYKAFKRIAEHLSKNGFVVLRCDDRGVGKSSGNLYNASYEDLLSDAIFMVAHLRGLEIVDTTKIGVIGISEGAALGGMLAGSSLVNFAVLLSFPALPGQQTMYQQISDLSVVYGLATHQRRMMINDFENINHIINVHSDEARRKENMEEYLSTYSEEMEALSRYFFIPPGPKEASDLSGKWYQSQLEYDPTGFLQSMDVPVLFMYGTNDPFVNWRNHIPRLESLVSKGHPAIKITKFDSTNHLFQQATNGSPLNYVKNNNDFSDKALVQLTRWIKDQTDIQ